MGDVVPNPIVDYVSGMSILNISRLRLSILALATLFWLASPGGAWALSTNARASHAILVDLSTAAILLEKDADAPIPPASMSKLMTLEVVFRALSEGRLSLDDQFLVSRKAYQMGGSKMFVGLEKLIRVEDLIRGIIISSGNDACIVIAEGFDGSEKAFAERLNRRAAQLGLLNSHFTNSSGWPDPQHRMSARDLAMLTTHIVRTYPQMFPIFSEAEFTWEGIKQSNRNPLLYAEIGADGMKTGYTRESGYSLVGTAVRGERRLVLVLAGIETLKARTAESRRLIEWGFREFKNGTFYEAGEIVGRAKVWMGEEGTVGLEVGETVRGTVPASHQEEAVATISIREPVEAPVEKGQQIGTITVEFPDGPSFNAPLVASDAVGKGNLFIRALTLLEHALFGESKE